MIKVFILFFLLVLLILLNKNITKEEFKEHKIKISIASMITKHPDFDYWVDYHINKLGIDKLFLRIENAPEYKKIVDKYPNNIVATFHTKEDIDTKHNYLTIMDRQKEHVNSSIEKALKLNIDYLFHIDIDELIHIEDVKNYNKPYLLRKYLESVKNEFTCIHFKNYEAVFPNKENKCFNTNKFIDCRKGGCLSYANGKSVGRINKGARFRGPHYFSGKTYDMNENISILHFDSCTFNQWKTKFNLLKDTNEEKMKKIPFPFYKNSIKKLKKCDKQSENTCLNDLNSYYSEQKINPFHDSKNLLEFNT